MNYSRVRWLILSLIVAGQLEGMSREPGMEWIRFAVVAAILGVAIYTLRPNVIGFLTHNRLMYRLRRTHNAVTNRIARPFGKPGLLERTYLHIRPPKWCRRSQDDLMLLYRDQKKLMDDGQVVIAMLVQADIKLFKKGYQDAAANVVYSGDFSAENLLQALDAVAVKIFGLKGTKPEDPDEQKFARMVSYEYGRDFRITVPDKLANGLDVTYTTIMVHRRHLPRGYLANQFFPLLIHEESRAAMILPARYWSKELLADWGIFEK